MASTTNYSWTTPDDTSLVKDGAAAIRTLGSSIDTTTKALNPSTTLGDIEYRSATANTNTRIPIGTSGQVLAVNGSGVPAWTTVSAGSMTVLASGSLSGSNVSLTSISGSYKDLILVTRDPSVSGDGNRSLIIYFNNDQTGLYAGLAANGSGTGLTATDTSIVITPTILASSSDGASFTRIFDYANTAAYKHVERWGWVQNAATPTWSGFIGSGFYRSTSAISRIDITATGGSSTLAGTYILYGVN